MKHNANRERVGEEASPAKGTTIPPSVAYQARVRKASQPPGALFTSDDQEDIAERSYPDAPRRFWKFLRRYKGLIGIAALGNAFTVFIFLLIPLFAKFVIDEAIPGKNTGLLIGLAVGLFLLQILRFAVG